MGEPIVVSWSEISTGRQCPHKHQLGYVERWTSEVRSPALLTGTAWHLMLEAHYGGQEVEPVLADVDDPERLELLAWMWDGYREFSATDDWEIVGVEQEFRVPLDPDGVYMLKGKIDLVVRWSGKLWLIDHKSGKRLPDDKELALDDQFGLYAWAMRELGTAAFGLAWSAAKTYRTKKPQGLDERFRRVWLHRTDAELDRVHDEALATVRWLYEDRPSWRSPDKDRCKWACDFTEACLFGRKEGDERERGALVDLGFVQDFTRH